MRPVSLVPFSESQEVVPAFSMTGPITLPAVHLHLDATLLERRRSEIWW